MIPKKTREQIKELYNKKVSIRGIAKITGCGQPSVYRVLDKKTKLRGEHCNRIDRKECAKMPKEYRNKKYTVRQLMARYGIKSQQTFYKILDEFGEPRIKA